jgi:hypothetical protein
MFSGVIDHAALGPVEQAQPPYQNQARVFIEGYCSLTAEESTELSHEKVSDDESCHV